ncbi:DMT family transporter [Streptomyces collinus]|uniref:DMT family transporter n=1 Tax=Streptomyces collinus TaxID=42684 RepID=UPI0036CCB21E
MSTVEPGVPSLARAGRGRRVAIIALTCATAVWGWSYLATVWLLPEMGTASLVAVRFLAAGSLMVAFRPRAIVALGRRHFLAGLALAFFLGTGTMLQVEGQHHIAASQSGFLTSLFVVLTPLVARLLFKAEVARGVWGAVVAAMAGLTVISFNGVSFGLGAWLTLAAALCYSVQMALLSAFSSADRVYGLASLQILGSGVIATVWALPAGVDLPDTAPGWGWLTYSTLLATLGMYAVQTWAQSRVPAATAAVVMACEPLFVAAFSLLVGIPLTTRTVVGGLLVLVAMYLVITSDRRAVPLHADSLAAPGAPPSAGATAHDPTRPARPGTTPGVRE